MKANGRLRGRCRGWRKAECMTNILFCYFSFWECSCPSTTSAINDIVNRLVERGFTPIAKRFADNLSSDLLPFARIPDGSPSESRGATSLNRALEMLKSTQHGTLNLHDLDKLASQAKDVHSDRMSLPAEAGQVDPAQILRGKH